jgi:hypothetical protein
MTAKTIDMPDVDACDARDCAFNKGGNCHARAITVGDGVHPGCDTFLPSGEHSRRTDRASVGACKVKGCKYNDDLECQAQAIRLGRRSNGIECLTFTSR